MIAERKGSAVQLNAWLRGVSPPVR